MLFFPASYRQAYAPETTDNANILLRAEVLKKLSSSKKPKIIVTYPQAVFEKIISQHTLKRITLKLKKDTEVSLNHINERLFEMGFERVDFVTSPGEFAVRGGIIDVFSFAYQHPYRIEFFDETIERLSSFDVNSQRSISAFEEIELLPNTSNHDFTDKRKTLLSFFSSESSIVFNDLDKTTYRLEQLYKKAENVYQELETTSQYAPEILFVKPEELITDCQSRSVFVLEKTTQINIREQILIKQSPQPAFNKKFDMLVSHLNENKDQGFTEILFFVVMINKPNAFMTFLMK